MNGDSPELPMELRVVPLYVMSTHRETCIHHNIHTYHTCKMAHMGNLVQNAKVAV